MKKLGLLLVALFVASNAPAQFIGGDRLTGARVSYSTTFPATENPISENSRWLGGAVNGVSWTNIRTQTNLAYGLDDGSAPPPYDDSFALLRPPTEQPQWGLTQDLRGTIVIANRGSWTNNHEVELLLRGYVAPGVARFYEVLFSVTTNTYVEIVRWNGPLGTGGCAANCAFTSLEFVNDGVQLNDGDRVRACIGPCEPGISAHTITLYRQQGAATTWTQYSISHDVSGDSIKYLSPGMPGIGVFHNGSFVAQTDVGFSSITFATW